MSLSLRTKTIGGVALIESVMLVILIVIAVGYLSSEINELLVKRARATAALFAATTKDALLSYDLASLDAFTDELLSNEDIAYVKIIGQNGVVLSEGGDEQHRQTLFVQDSRLSDVDDSIFDTFAIIQEDTYEYGRVELGIRITDTQLAIARVRNWSVSVALIELFLVGIFSYFLGTYLTRQLSTLRTGAKKVRKSLIQGNLVPVQVPVKGNDELSELTVSFNELVKSLQKELELNAEQKQHLQDLNASLEAKVQARTQALSEKNDALMVANISIKETQQQLLHAEKMSSVGQLAAGVAHEINTPIGFVSSNVSTLKDYVAVYQLVLREMQPLVFSKGSDTEKMSALKALFEKHNLSYISEDISDLLKESEEGLLRVSDIVGGLKIFSHVGSDEMQIFDINDCIKTTLKMLNNELKFVCDIETHYGELPKLLMNVGKISQVLTNILMNAGHAIKSTEQYGKITITTLLDQNDIVVQIMDTGPGIPETVKNELFNPFFTTKEEGEGTGLGLSISIGIMTEHQGSIEVDSELGKGAIFILRLPIERETIKEGAA